MHKKYLFSLMIGVGVLGVVTNGCSSGKGDDWGTPIPTAGNQGKGGASGQGGSSASSQGGKSSSNGGSTSVAGANTGTGGGASACRGLPPKEEEDGEKCVGIGHEAERSPVDMYIMMDRSISMNKKVGGTDDDASLPDRWTVLHSAMEEFVTKAAKTDLRAGIAFFPYDTSGDDVDNDNAENCKADNYATPVVAIDAVSKNGEDLLAAMDDNLPSGYTPTAPAITGALQHAKDWQQDNAGRATVVVMVTDGYPTTCPLNGDKLGLVREAAKSALAETPRIKTYVVGIGAVDNLESVAKDGGSNKAFVVDDTANASVVTTKLVDALMNISQSPLVCSFGLPPPPDMQMLDPNKVQMIYTPATGDAEEIPKVSSSDACADSPNGGWYYDNPSRPTSIQVCPCTCSRFGAGTVNIRVGCTPIMIIE